VGIVGCFAVFVGLAFLKPRSMTAGQEEDARTVPI